MREFVKKLINARRARKRRWRLSDSWTIAASTTTRQLNAIDIILDYGAGPGITLEEIFFVHKLSVPTIGQAAYVCDASSDMVRRSHHLATFRCPTKGVLCKQVSTVLHPRQDIAAV